MLMTEWNTEEAKKVWKEEAWEEGIQKGRQEGRQEGRREGREEGREEGEAKKQREIALKMLRRGLPLEYVIEDTGLSLAEIQFLQLQQS
jgi:predicted transposase/invertase (TIGR01784 family)